MGYVSFQGGYIYNVHKAPNARVLDCQLRERQNKNHVNYCKLTISCFKYPFYRFNNRSSERQAYLIVLYHQLVE